ncbi:MAG: preprotein translocase subunit SecG [Bacilli bacterium]
MEKIITIIFAIVALLLITVVLIQSSKASDASSALTGGIDLFTDRKERGIEVLITRTTFVLGISFCAIAFILANII